MDTVDGAGGFVGKWQARWPEWAPALVFVPAAQRARVASWFALLQELGDAALGGSDPTPGLAKLAWWQDELRGWSKGARRHPLGAVLQPVPAPWDRLALALPALQARRRRPGEAPVAASALILVADAVAACESALFGGAAGATTSVLVAGSLAAEHALQHPDTAPAPAVADWHAAPAATRPRAIHAAFVHARGLGGGDAPPLAPLRAVLLAWRVARRVR